MGPGMPARASDGIFRGLLREGRALALFRALAGTAGIFALAPAMSAPSLAATATECMAISICYCVNADFKSAIDANVAKLRQRIAEEKSKGKTIGYLSIPLSTAGGGYFNVNKEIAAQAKTRIEQRFGANLLWILNPGAEQASLPPGASGADYMLMWTRILEGDGGLGEDFDCPLRGSKPSPSGEAKGR